MNFNRLAVAAFIALPFANAAFADSGSTPDPVVAAPVVNTGIQLEEVIAAQKAWGDALVAISDAYETGGQAAARALAEKVIDSAYGYQFGPVLFKPTLTVSPQTFRTTREGALAYFVGGDPNYPNDTGFALKGWKSVEIKNAAVFLAGDVATTMGNVMVTDKNGKVTTVDKTWQYRKDDQGHLRIMVHHSSLPYQTPSLSYQAAK